MRPSSLIVPSEAAILVPLLFPGLSSILLCASPLGGLRDTLSSQGRARPMISRHRSLWVARCGELLGTLEKHCMGTLAMQARPPQQE